MKKSSIGVVFLILVVGVSITWWLVSPLFLDKVVSEDIPSSSMEKEKMDEMNLETHSKDEKEIIMENEMLNYQGTFLNGDDSHHTKGNITTISQEKKTYLRFEKFETTNGPDLYLYLTKDKNVVEDGMVLGKLKGNIGDQNYEIPNDVRLSEEYYVVIWCKAFNVIFGYAKLTPQH